MLHKKFLIVILLSGVFAIRACAQPHADTAIISGHTYIIMRTDGVKFTGKVLNQSADDVMIDEKKTGMAVLHKKDIKSVTEIKTPVKMSGKVPEITAGDNKGPYIYAELGGGIGTHNNFKMAMNVLHNNRIFSVSVCVSNRIAHGLPDDASHYFDNTPRQSLGTLAIMSGMVIRTNSPLRRYVLKGGISAGMCETPVDFVKVHNNWYSEYHYTTNRQLTAGLVLNPTMELPVAPGFGFSGGLYANINPACPVFGVEACIIFGRMREWSKNEQDRMHRKRMAMAGN